MKPEFAWAKPVACPDGLPLYRLQKGDVRKLSEQVSCHQSIAADGCFSLGVNAELAGYCARSERVKKLQHHRRDVQRALAKASHPGETWKIAGKLGVGIGIRAYRSRTNATAGCQNPKAGSVEMSQNGN